MKIFGVIKATIKNEFLLNCVSASVVIFIYGYLKFNPLKISNI